MALFGQDRPNPAFHQLGAVLGDLVGGGPARRAEAGFEPRVQQHYTTHKMLEEARRATSNRIIDEGRARYSQEIPTMWRELGITEAEAKLLAAGGGNANQYMDARNAAREYAWRQDAVDAARYTLGEDNPNTHLFGVANGPVALTNVTDGTAYSPLELPGRGNMVTTEVGQSTIRNRDRSIFDAGTNGIFNIDKATNTAAPVNILGEGPEGLPAMSNSDPFAGLLASVPDLRVTSRQRTPEHNARVGGVRNSYHLTGEAIDIGRPSPEQQAAITQWAQANGYRIKNDYADGHWHLEPARRGSGGGGRQLVSAGKPSSASNAATPASREALADQHGLTGEMRTRYILTGNLPASSSLDGGADVNANLNPRQRVAVQGVQRNLIQYAAALLGKDPSQLEGMTSQEIADEIASSGSRFAQGGTARFLENNPTPIIGGWLSRLGETSNRVANADILSYSQGAGAAWAAFENPTGIITNADRETATAQMPNYLDPPEVQAQKIRSFLELSGYQPRGGARNARTGAEGLPPPRTAAAPTQATPQRARNPATGEVVELRNGQWVPVR